MGNGRADGLLIFERMRDLARVSFFIHPLAGLHADLIKASGPSVPIGRIMERLVISPASVLVYRLLMQSTSTRYH